MLIQPDGHIVTVGPREVGNNFHFQFGATRHDAAGNLDPTFGTGGIVTTSLGGNEDKAFDAALLSDGGFVAVGQADPAGLWPTPTSASCAIPPTAIRTLRSARAGS